jgi:hypothetical protein
MEITNTQKTRGKRVFGLTEEEYRRAPWFIKFAKLSAYILIAWGLFVIPFFLWFFWGSTGSLSLFGKIMGYIFIGGFIFLFLNLFILQIGFLIDALKNRRIDYFFLLLILGFLFWGYYTKKCLMPRLTDRIN